MLGVRTLAAVDVDNRVKYLRSLGVYDALERNKLKCGICAKPVGLHNLQCVYPDSGEVKVCCDSVLCYLQLLERRQTRELIAP